MVNSLTSKFQFGKSLYLYLFTLFRLKTHTVIAGRLAKMLGAVTAEVRERREVHQVGYLGEGQAFIIQIVFQYRYGVSVDV